MKTRTPTSRGVRLVRYGAADVALETMTSTMATRAAGMRPGERRRAAHPRVASFRTMPRTAGSATVSTTLSTMGKASTRTAWPRRTCSVAGMVTGARTEDTMSVASPSATLPPNMDIHMVEIAATGTLYSSTMPVTRCMLLPNKALASRNATTGITPDAKAIVSSMGTGRLTAWARLRSLLVRAPWNDTSANSHGTAGARWDSCAGNAHAATTHATAMGAMWAPMNFPNECEASKMACSPAVVAPAMDRRPDREILADAPAAATRPGKRDADVNVRGNAQGRGRTGARVMRTEASCCSRGEGLQSGWHEMRRTDGRSSRPRRLPA